MEQRARDAQERVNRKESLFEVDRWLRRRFEQPELQFLSSGK